MSNRRPILGFLIRFLLLYVLLMVPWPGVRTAYRSFFIGGSRGVFATFTSQNGTRISAIDHDDQNRDTEITFPHMSGLRWEMGVNSGEIAYFPSAILLALILSTPVAWKRRGQALALGFLLVNGFIILRMTIMILIEANRPVSFQPTLWMKTASATAQFIGVGPGLSIIAAVVIWFAVLLRRQDLKMFLGETDSQTPDKD